MVLTTNNSCSANHNPISTLTNPIETRGWEGLQALQVPALASSNSSFSAVNVTVFLGEPFMGGPLSDLCRARAGFCRIVFPNVRLLISKRCGTLGTLVPNLSCHWWVCALCTKTSGFLLQSRGRSCPFCACPSETITGSRTFIVILARVIIVQSNVNVLLILTAVCIKSLLVCVRNPRGVVLMLGNLGYSTIVALIRLGFEA